MASKNSVFIIDAVKAGKRKIPVGRDGSESLCRCHDKLQLVAR